MTFPTTTSSGATFPDLNARPTASGRTVSHTTQVPVSAISPQPPPSFLPKIYAIPGGNDSHGNRLRMTVSGGGKEVTALEATLHLRCQTSSGQQGDYVDIISLTHLHAALDTSSWLRYYQVFGSNDALQVIGPIGAHSATIILTRVVQVNYIPDPTGLVGAGIPGPWLCSGPTGAIGFTLTH